MDQEKRMKLLKILMVVLGVGFIFALYPLHIFWPSGWGWHHGQGEYYFQMIAITFAVLGVCLIIAAKNPAEHISLLWFTVWSNLGHGVVMLFQAVIDETERGHLVADVPFLIIAAALMAYLMPKKAAA